MKEIPNIKLTKPQNVCSLGLSWEVEAALLILRLFLSVRWLLAQSTTIQPSRKFWLTGCTILSSAYRCIGSNSRGFNMYSGVIVVTKGVQQGSSLSSSLLNLTPISQSPTTDLKGQSSISQHIFCRGKPLGKFAKTTSSWSHLSLRNLLCCELYLAFLPLCHCTLPISPLYHPVPCSIITLLVCALCLTLSHYTLSFSLSLCTSLIHFMSFICSAFLSLSSVCFALFMSAGKHVRTGNVALWPLLWYSKQSEGISHFVPIPLQNVFWTYVATSAPLPLCLLNTLSLQSSFS